MDREEIIIQRGESSDVNDIIDFGNFVFSMAHRPHSFDSLLPKCYGEGQNHADWHYLVKDNKRIQAMLMSMPQVVSMQHVYPGVVFQRNGIGTVSVHHRARSKGYMRELMNEALQDMWDDGVAYSFLGGQRQRYRYFGYDHAGTVLNASLSLRNMTMTWPSLRDLQVPDDMSLIDCPVSGPILDQVYNLYLKTHALNVRPKEDFALICRTFGRQAKVLLRGGDEVLAYIVGTEDLSHVDEIVKADAALPWEWLLFYLINLANVQQITFSLPQAIVGEALDLHRALLFAAENYSVVSGGMIRVLDFAKTIAMLLAEKAIQQPLAMGRLELQILDCPPPSTAVQLLVIEVTSNRLIVSRAQETILDVKLPLPTVAADRDAMNAELSISYLDSLSTLFSYQGLLSGDLYRLLPSEQASWFPLNPSVQSADNA